MKFTIKTVFLLSLCMILLLPSFQCLARTKNEEYVTYQEYKEAVLNEYQKFEGGDKVTITDPPNAEKLQIPIKLLNLQLKRIQTECMQSQTQNLSQTNKLPAEKIEENNISTRNMPYEDTASFTKTIFSKGLVTGNASFVVTLNYYGNIQYGSITGIKSGSVEQLGYSVNLNSWEDHGYSVNSLGKTANVTYTIWAMFTHSGAIGESYSYSDYYDLNCIING